MVDGAKATEILRSLTVLTDVEACTKRERESAAEPDAAAAVRMLTESFNATGGTRVGTFVFRFILVIFILLYFWLPKAVCVFTAEKRIVPERGQLFSCNMCSVCLMPRLYRRVFLPPPIFPVCIALRQGEDRDGPQISRSAISRNVALFVPSSGPRRRWFAMLRRPAVRTPMSSLQGVCSREPTPAGYQHS